MKRANIAAIIVAAVLPFPARSGGHVHGECLATHQRPDEHTWVDRARFGRVLFDCDWLRAHGAASGKEIGIGARLLDRRRRLLQAESGR